MKYRFRFAYYDLGELRGGDTVVVRLESAANVLLLDPQNFARYRGGSRFESVGGHFRRSDVRLDVPHDGHWYVAMDLGGRPGHARGSIKVLAADGTRRELGRATPAEQGA